MVNRSFLARLAAVMALVLPALASCAAPDGAHVLDKRKILEKQTFWDNRDWDWYIANIPFFESPDPELDTTYYYRWELITKHLTYGSPRSGYSFTEFIDRPFWSGAYGAISCPAGHQLYETRWLKDPRYARDYARYWLRTPGAQPRNYSTWLADSVWAIQMVQGDEAFAADLLEGLIENYQGWEKTHYVPEQGMFWQTGHDDGMEININSRQTKDTVRGAPGYRTTLNSYLWADAMAIARIARLKGDVALAAKFEDKARILKENVQKKLWDPKREFFFQMYKNDETRDGDTIKAGSLTYQTGKYAGSPHGRELYNYTPWQFNMPDAGFEVAWKYLMDPDYFFAAYGPTTTERHDPQFLIAKYCCVWSGHSWPYATSQTLVAMANLLNNYRQPHVTKDDYARLLRIYARTHRKNGKPYIAEGAHPDTGSWEGYDSYNHSEHYFHSSFTDLVITGLAGLRPRADDVIEIHPLIPDDWAYLALDDVRYRGRRVTILWDKAGDRYGRGPGLHLIVDGKPLASLSKLGRIVANLPPRPAAAGAPAQPPMNFAVSNDGDHFPAALASHVGKGSLLASLHDGHSWYHISPPNRWTSLGSGNPSDWCAIELGAPRRIDTVKLYVLDDGKEILAPAKIDLQYWNGKEWAAIPGQRSSPAKPQGHRANVVRFPLIEVQKIRTVLTHQPGASSGLSELEAWGPHDPDYKPAPSPAGNLALNVAGVGFPVVSASFTSRFDKTEKANDGKVVYRPTPNNRWTSYESPNETDWLQVDFGPARRVGRVELCIFDDHGGVQAPRAYEVQYWDGAAWKPAQGQAKTPEKPAGGMRNRVTFTPVSTPRIRILFTHRDKARSGVTEIEAWEQ